MLISNPPKCSRLGDNFEMRLDIELTRHPRETLCEPQRLPGVKVWMNKIGSLKRLRHRKALSSAATFSCCV